MRVSYESPSANRRRSLFALVGLRPVYAEHSRGDEQLLRSLAKSARAIVEIGSAEGTSALAIRESMPADAHLWCVDPYVSRIPGLSPRELVAHRVVRSSHNGTVTWVKAYSHDAAAAWRGPEIDLLFVDGDHSYEGVSLDWRTWQPHLAGRATVVFDDAAGAAVGWGPGRLVDEEFADGRSAWHVTATGDRYVVVAR